MSQGAAFLIFSITTDTNQSGGDTHRGVFLFFLLRTRTKVELVLGGFIFACVDWFAGFCDRAHNTKDKGVVTYRMPENYLAHFPKKMETKIWLKRN